MQSELEHGLHHNQFFLIWNMHLPERHTFIWKLSIAEIHFENEPGLETDSKADTTCESNSCFGTEKQQINSFRGVVFGRDRSSGGQCCSITDTEIYSGCVKLCAFPFFNCASWNGAFGKWAAPQGIQQDFRHSEVLSVLILLSVC